GLRAAARRRSPPRRRAGLAGRPPVAVGAGAGRGGPGGPALAEALGARRRPGAPARDRRGAAAGGGAQTRQPHRDRLGRPHDRARRDARPAAALPPRAPLGRGDLVPALQRTRGRVGPRRPQHQGGAGRRQLGRARPEGVDVARPQRPLRDPDRPHRSRRGQAQGHLVLRVPDGHARDRDPADHRDDGGPHVQRGVPRRRPPPRRRPHRRGPRGLDAGQGDAVERAGLALIGRRAVGQRSRSLRPVRRGAGRGGHRRPAPAPAARGALDRGGDPPPHPAANGERPRAGGAAGARGLDPEDAGRRARPVDHGPGQGPRRQRRDARDCRPARPERPPRLVLRVPVRPRPHRRRRDERGAAQHRRRAGARPAPRRGRRGWPHLRRDLTVWLGPAADCL
ncbi:MAG: Acyl-CoA dehydrogenase, long-chain specific, partial [uncultured Acidimicrobiales bacterium]